MEFRRNSVVKSVSLPDATLRATLNPCHTPSCAPPNSPAWAASRGSAQHNFREQDTPNADPERTALNRTNGAQSSKELVAEVKARLATQDKVRKNAVLAVEYFVGASPEWFSQADAKQREAYFDQAEKWLKDRHGAENVIAVTRQYDETSPSTITL